MEIYSIIFTKTFQSDSQAGMGVITESFPAKLLSSKLHEKKKFPAVWKLLLF